MTYTRQFFALIATATIAGCSGTAASQNSLAPIAGAFPVPQSHSALSWMLPNASKQDKLLYVSDETEHSNTVDVYSYPQGKLEGTIALTAGNDPAGMCVNNSNGDVYIENGNSDQILVFAHGGTTPLNIFKLTDYPRYNCAVDPKRGTLAVGVHDISPQASLDVFPDGNTKAGRVYPGNFAGCAYDAGGNLFCSGRLGSTTAALFELQNGKRKLEHVKVKGTATFPFGPMQWDGRELTVGTTGGLIYQITSNSSGYAIGGSTTLSGAGFVQDYWIDNNRLIAPTYGGSLGSTIAYFDYPAGGPPTKKVRTTLTEPFGVALSVIRN